MGIWKLCNRKLDKFQKGFTLLEMLLVIALIALVAGSTITIFITTKNKTDLAIVQDTTVQYIRMAQSFSKAGKEDSEWGVNIDSDRIILFKGIDFDNRDIAFDEFYNYPTRVNVIGITDLYFNKITGTPSVSGTTTLTGRSDSSTTIFVNQLGLVNY